MRTDKFHRCRSGRSSKQSGKSNSRKQKKIGGLFPVRRFEFFLFRLQPFADYYHQQCHDNNSIAPKLEKLEEKKMIQETPQTVK